MGDALHTSFELTFLLLLSFPPKTSFQHIQGFFVSQDLVQTPPPLEAVSDFADTEVALLPLGSHGTVCSPEFRHFAHGTVIISLHIGYSHPSLP